MPIVKFTVEVDGVEYQCKRDVEGKSVLTQTIYVEGFGTKVDEKEYGNKLPYEKIYLMDHFAKQIARSIIRKPIDR